MLGQQGLVGRHDGLALTQGAQDKTLGDAGAADQLDHHVDRGIVDHRIGIGRQHPRLNAHAAITLDIQVRNAAHHQLHAEAFSHDRAVLLESLDHAGTHGTKPKQTYSDFTHM